METLKSLKNIRKKNNKTQAELASVLGVARNTYCQYETGRLTMTPRQICLLADFYNISTDELLGRNQELFEDARITVELSQQDSTNLRIRELRVQKGLTQHDLAIFLDCSNNKYASWEQGRTEPSIDDILKLADFFQCSVDYLLGREDEEGIIVMKADADFSAEELELVQNFRQLNAGAQAELKGFVRGLLAAPMLTRKNTSA